VESPKSYVCQRHSSSDRQKHTTATFERAAMLNLEDLTGYKIVYIGIFGDPGKGCIRL